jgi:hypothetical protein
VVPTNPAGQEHVKVLFPSAQVPPFRQGFGLHSLTFVWQVVPVNPGLQAQVKVLTPSVQVPAFRQGFGLQLSILV